MIPKMPALGLLLEYPLFHTYNVKITKSQLANAQPDSPEYRPPLDFAQHEEKMTAFKQKYIYDNMREIEDRKGL